MRPWNASCGQPRRVCGGGEQECWRPQDRHELGVTIRLASHDCEDSPNYVSADIMVEIPMDLGLHGSRALITWGSWGIGSGVADALAAEGAVVGLIARDANGLAAAVQHWARRAHLATEVADVTNIGALNCAVDEIAAALGVLDDHLVAN